MYPDLSYFFHALFGTQPDNFFSIIKTFGFFLVLAILSAAAILYKEILRKEAAGLLLPTKKTVIEGKPATPIELVLNAVFGFIVGAKFLYALQHFTAFKVDPADIILSAKGNILGGIVGAIIFAGLKYWEKRSVQVENPEPKEIDIYPHDRIGDITVAAAISGIVGAKVFAIIEDLPAFFADPLGTFFSGSGMAIYGGLIGGFVFCFFYLKRLNIPPIQIVDAVAPALMVAYGIGRLGCHFSGDGDWGIVAETAKPSWFIFPDWAWSFTYPHNVLTEGIPIEGCKWRYCNELAQAVYVTSIWEFVFAMCIGGFLWSIRKRITIPGILFSIYLFLNGFERYFIETIRVNDRYNFLGFDTTQAQLIALFMMLSGIIAGFIFWKNGQTPAHKLTNPV